MPIERSIPRRPPSSGIRLLLTVALLSLAVAVAPSGPLLAAPPAQPPDLRPQGYFPLIANGFVHKPLFRAVELSPWRGCARRAYVARTTDLAIRSSAIDGRDTLWIGTNQGAYGLLSDQGMIWLRNEIGLAHDEVDAIAIDRQGLPWFGGNIRHRYANRGGLFVAGGISHYDYEHIRTQRNTADAGSGVFGTVESLAVDTSGALWVDMGIYVLGHDLYRFGVFRLQPPRSWTSFAMRAGVDTTTVHGVVADASGNVWLRHDRGLIVRRPDGAWSDELGPGAPAAGSTRQIATSPTGRDLWLLAGSGDGGRLYRWRDAGPWHDLGAVPEPLTYAHTMAGDEAGNLWWASEVGGGVRMDRDGAWHAFARDDLFGESYVERMDPAGLDAVLVQTTFEGEFDAVVRVTCTAGVR